MVAVRESIVSQALEGVVSVKSVLTPRGPAVHVVASPSSFKAVRAKLPKTMQGVQVLVMTQKQI